MTAFTNHFAFEFNTGIRNPMLMFMNYLFPLAFYAMMGAVMTSINPLFKDTMLPAMAIFTVMTANILSLPNPLVESRQAGVFRSFKINGVPAVSILAIPILTSVFHSLIAAAIIAATAAPLFKAVPPADWLAFGLITLLAAVTCGALGALIGVVARDSRATVLLSQLIFLPSMLLGGLMVPLDLLPETARPISLLLPASHAMQAYQGFAYRQPTVIGPALAVGVLATSAVIAFGLAVFLFNWDDRNSTRRGHPAMALLALAPYIVAIVAR